MKKLKRAIVGACMVCLLAGCGAESGKEQDALNVTVTPAMSEEVTATPEPTATPAPTATPKPTATPIAAPTFDEAYWQSVLDEFSDSGFDLTTALMQPALKDYCKGYFKLGVGLTGSTFEKMAIHSDEYMTVAGKHFNSVTLTNLMKPVFLLDQQGCEENAAAGNEEPAVTFTCVDEVLQWCVDNNVPMRGHTLVWHTQTPDWFFREGYKTDGEYVDRDTMLLRLDSYIKQVMTYCQDTYPGAIYCWDVVNEAVDEAGDPDSFYLCRTKCDEGPNPWYVVVGDDYVEQAFRSARKYAAEGVKLFYNDFNTYFATKRDAIYRLCEHLKNEGLIDGIGMQAYWTGANTDQIEQAIKKFAKLGLEIQITELSIDAEDLSEEELKKQANSYGSLFFMFSYLDDQGGGPANITAVTLFGLQDGFVMYDGTDKTTSRIFDKDFQPKPAFERIAKIMGNTYKNREE